MVMAMAVTTSCGDDATSSDASTGDSTTGCEDTTCGCDEVLEPPTGMCIPDCQDPASSCVAPFTCQMQDGDFQCLDESDASCTGWPDMQTVPFQTVGETMTGATIHWEAGGCIAVSYDAGIADISSLLTMAVDAWNAVPCSTICLDPPVQMEDPPSIYRGERRIHFTRGIEGGSPGIVAVPTLYHSQTSGRARGAVVEIAEEPDPPTTLTDLLFLVGSSLGLAPAPVGSDSVMLREAGRAAPTAPTSLDEEAICALYGDPAYCGDTM